MNQRTNKPNKAIKLHLNKIVTFIDIFIIYFCSLLLY